MELKMCSRNHHTNRSFMLAWFEGEENGRREVYEIRFTTDLSEEVSYQASRGAHRLAG